MEPSFVEIRSSSSESRVLRSSSSAALAPAGLAGGAAAAPGRLAQADSTPSHKSQQIPPTAPRMTRQPRESLMPLDWGDGVADAPCGDCSAGVVDITPSLAAFLRCRQTANPQTSARAVPPPTSHAVSDDMRPSLPHAPCAGQRVMLPRVPSLAVGVPQNRCGTLAGLRRDSPRQRQRLTAALRNQQSAGIPISALPVET